MAHESRNRSLYDKNIRSLIEAMAMLEKEIGIVMDRVGVDGSTLRRALDVLMVLSSDVARQAVAALGLADARATETLASDVRALLEQVARLRRRDSETHARLDRLEEASARLDGAVSTLARLQGKAQGVIARLEEKSEAFEQVLERRTQQHEALDGLRTRIEQLERMIAAPTPEAGLKPLPTSRLPRPVRALEPAPPATQDDTPIAATAKPIAR